MADLNQLRDALESIRLNRKTAKLFFYFVNKEDGRMQSGFFSISEGKTCCINYLNKPNETALAEIPHLNLTKVTSLPATLMDLSGQPFPACELDDVLKRLGGTNRVNTVPAKEPELQAVVEPASADVVPTTLPHDSYSPIKMQQDAINLLESLYGPDAIKRVEEIAIALPPNQYPTEFLNKCKLHASMMIGPRKAEEIFQPIYKKLTRENGSHGLTNPLA